MPLWAKIYIIIFLLFTISNMGYSIYLRNRILLVLYDFFSNMFFIFAMLSYWRPVVKTYISPVGALIFFFMLGLEIYFTSMGGYEKLGLKTPEGITKDEIEGAVAISLLFSAPAYIIGGLSMLNILVGK